MVLALRNLERKKVITESILAMGTTARITIVVDNPTRKKILSAYAAIDEAFSLLKKNESALSFYSTSSELKAINEKAAAAKVKISGLMYEVLEKSLAFAKLTEGAFDITATSLQKEGGYGSIILNPENKTVYFKNKKAKIDLGGIAAGFAIDKIAEHFKRLRIENYLIDVGGDIYARGLNEKGVPWQIGVRDPVRREEIVEKISITNMAVTTSGNYIKNHIIDPQTSSLADSDLLSVTVAAPECVQADVLATAFFVMGRQKSKAVISLNNLDVKVLFITDKNGNPEVEKYNWEN